MKETLPPYQVDRKGYYWEDPRGRRFRSIDVVEDKLVYLTPTLLAARTVNREQWWLMRRTAPRYPRTGK